MSVGHDTATKPSAEAKPVPSRYWPRVVCRDAAQVETTLTVAKDLGLPVTIVSPAAETLDSGPHHFLHMVLQASEKFPGVTFRAVLDCGEGVGYAIAVIRRAATGTLLVGESMDWSLQLEARPNLLVKVRDLANLQGVSVDSAIRRAVEFDKLKDPVPALRAWLDHGAASGKKAAANESSGANRAIA